MRNFNMKKYPYVIFSPHFGKLPKYFKLWVHSCSYNKNFLFIVFTDCHVDGALPDNVLVYNIKFEEMKKKIQQKLDFKISLDNPYKLCDYKPLFGYLFDEFLNQAKYWGHCDMDLIFGDIEKFLPSLDFDKISHLGHLSLYRNTPQIRAAFSLSSPHAVTFKDILASHVNFAFDEDPEYGINAIFASHNLSIFPYEKSVAEISPIHLNFVLNHRDYPHITHEFGDFIFSFESGKVYGCSLKNGQIEKREVSYIHLQKRSMQNLLSQIPEKFLITYSLFRNWEEPTKHTILSSLPKYPKISSFCTLLKVKKKTAPKRIARIVESYRMRLNKKI